MSTVGNNLGPKRQVGQKALYPYYYRQPTLWLYNFCPEVENVYGNEKRLFLAKAFPLLLLLMSRIWHNFNFGKYTHNFFSYEAVWAVNRTYPLPSHNRE